MSTRREIKRSPGLHLTVKRQRVNIKETLIRYTGSKFWCSTWICSWVDCVLFVNLCLASFNILVYSIIHILMTHNSLVGVNVQVGCTLVGMAEKIRNLWVTFNQTLWIQTHVNAIAGVRFYYLRNTARIIRLLSDEEWSLFMWFQNWTTVSFFSMVYLIQP